MLLKQYLLCQLLEHLLWRHPALLASSATTRSCAAWSITLQICKQFQNCTACWSPATHCLVTRSWTALYGKGLYSNHMGSFHV